MLLLETVLLLPMLCLNVQLLCLERGGGNENIRAKSAMKSIAREYSDVTTASSGKMDADDVLGMMTEANIKCAQLRTINRHAKPSTKVNIMCKEENIRTAIDSACIIKFKEFREIKIK